MCFRLKCLLEIESTRLHVLQVTSLRQELQMLASSRPVTIVTASGTGLGSDPSLASETGDEICCVHPVLTTHLWTGLVNVELLPILLLEKLLKA